MIYKFKSRATGDLIMLAPHGDQVLELLGRTPSAKGIIEVADMAAAIQTLESAVKADEQRVDQPSDTNDTEPGEVRHPVGLRQRLWPMIEMLRRALAADEAVVWGV